jgi:tRNA threonylcarbamoyladenosine biosynthesis protein TsaB
LPLLLNIDTATEHASVCISDGEKVLALIGSQDQKNHASFVQPAIETLSRETGVALKNIDAVAVTAGPGSYTGLRVGLASAKGICYALQKPLILVNTLEVMANALHHTMDLSAGSQTLLCPMIDARRMEVFTAVYNSVLSEIQAPHALILDPSSFTGLLADYQVFFSGSGHIKLKTLIGHPNAHFSTVQHTAADLASRAIISYESNRFADIAYSEPLYVKEFFNPTPRSGTSTGP